MSGTSTLSLHLEASGERQTTRFLTLALSAEAPLADPIRTCLDAGIREVAIGRGAERSAAVDGGQLRISVPDRSMSSQHAVLTRVDGRWHVLDQDSKNGTFVAAERCERRRLEDGDVIELGATAFVFREVRLSGSERLALAHRRDPGAGPPALRTMHPGYQRDLELLTRVARSDTPIMIDGATGSGKELLARAIHAISGRGGAYVPVNCGAIAGALLESELFGHRKGAFSGADAEHDGLLVAADGGTLMLDEIAEMPSPVQVALLRALQEGEVRAVGASRPRRIDLRVVTATHARLDEQVAAGHFRPDLFARLAGFRFEIPGLARRIEDVGLITAALLGKLAGDRADRLRLHPAVCRHLLHHSWPLNVRELEQALRVALSLAEGDVLEIEHLPGAMGGHSPLAEPAADARMEQLVALLKIHHGNVSAVARAMETSRAQVRRLADRYSIDPASYRP